jgi:hypothetical protein
MEDEKGSYSHKEEIIGLHVSMGNDDTKPSGRSDMKEPVTMRILQRELQSYWDDIENIMKALEDILQSLNMLLQIPNMLYKQVNKDSGTEKEASARHMELSSSNDRRQ